MYPNITITTTPAPAGVQLTIKPSEAQPGDQLLNWPTTDPTIYRIEYWQDDGFVKITFRDGGVLNTYDRFPITVARGEA